MSDLDERALEAAAIAGREAVRPYQRLNPGENGAQSSLEWSEMQEVYQRPFRMIARAAVTAYLAEAGVAGFRIIEPGHIPMPQTKEEARAMILLGESFLAAANERDAAPPAAQDPRP